MTAGVPPVRVWVVGCSGAGKTTLAREAARRLAVLHVELDEVFWDAGWQKRDVPEARALLAERLAAGDSWVVDGNWTSRGHGLDRAATIVVWLDLPRRVVMMRVVTRTVRRGITRQELWHGNRERLTNLLRRDPEENVVRWAWTQFDRYRETYGALAAADPRVVHLTSRAAARAWLGALEPVRAPRR